MDLLRSRLPICPRRAAVPAALLVLGLTALLPGALSAQEVVLDLPQPVGDLPELSSGDTAWMLTSTALVLFMTIPGLALFYGGLVRTKNVLSVLMQCFAICCLMTLLWVILGYSLAFTDGGGLNRFVGGLDKIFLKGVARDSLSGSIPESVWITFQMTFAIITPALIVGAFAERMKFSAVMIYSALWMLLVYAPICHMAWSGDGALFWDMGVLDFAGGTVVHINAGAAALVACLLIGKRQGFPNQPMKPHNLGMTVTGASMLWVGWFGFNAGSAAGANESAGMAMLVTQVATATAALAWTGAEWLRHGKPSVLGIVTGAVAGLVAITPASGSVGPMGAIVIGAASGFVCFWGATTLKKMGGYDDSLDAFGVHGIGGIVGCLLTGVFASAALGGSEDKLNIGSQFTVQAISAVVTFAYSAIVTLILFKVIDAMVGLRVEEEAEVRGLDISEHDEVGYNLT